MPAARKEKRKGIWTVIRAGFDKGRLLLLLAGLLFSVLMGVLYLYEPLFMRILDQKFYDSMLRGHHSTETSGVPVIVDIDEQSLDSYGQWPWPRYQVARLLKGIQDLGAESVGLDMVFAEPDRTSLAVIQKDLEELDGVELSMELSDNIYLDNDLILARALAEGPFVLGYPFDFEGQKGAGEDNTDCTLHPINLPLIYLRGLEPTDDLSFLPMAPAVTCNVPVLTESVDYSGFFSTVPDADGTLRRTPLLIQYKGKTYPSLALASFLKYLGRKQAVLVISELGAVELRVKKNLTIPLDSHGNMLLHWRGPGKTFSYYSAADVMDGKLNPDEFKDKIVLLGTSAAGLKDLRVTPMDPHYPGVEAHATLIDTMIMGDFLSRPDWAPGLEFVFILFLGLISTLLLTWAGALLSLLPLAGLAVGLWYWSMGYMEKQGIYISPFIPLITLAGNFTLLTMLKYWREESQKRFFHSAFSKYVSKAVVDQLVKTPEKLDLIGEEKEVSILFSDIRGFTSLSEELQDHQVSELLKAYFTPMTRKVTEWRGTMDKFIGDAIMAFWNAPLDTPGHQALAVRSALDMLDELEKLNPTFKEKYGNPLAIGIGLHCGRVRVGNMGSADLFDYTLIGDNVNLASRVESLTKFYGLRLLVTDTIRDACPDEFPFLEVDTVQVKGKQQPISIHTAFATEVEAEAQGAPLFRKGLALYKGRDFAKARELFARLYEKDNGLSKLGREYSQRCLVLEKNPPPAGWNHVFVHKSK